VSKVLVFPNGEQAKDQFIPVSELVELDVDLVEQGLLKMVSEANDRLRQVVRERGKQLTDECYDPEKYREMGMRLVQDVSDAVAYLDRTQAALGAIREIRDGAIQEAGRRF